MGSTWSQQSAKDKQPYVQETAKLKETLKRILPHTMPRAKMKTERRPLGSKKKNEPEDEEGEKTEEDNDEEEMGEDEE